MLTPSTLKIASKTTVHQRTQEASTKYKLQRSQVAKRNSDYSLIDLSTLSNIT